MVRSAAVWTVTVGKVTVQSVAAGSAAAGSGPARPVAGRRGALCYHPPVERRRSLAP